LDEWVVLIQSNVTGSGNLQLSDKTMTLQNFTVIISPSGEEKK